MLGEHARKDEIKTRKIYPNTSGTLSVPFNFPSFVLNGYSLKAFNALYYAKNLKRSVQTLTPYEKFFYP